MNSEAAKPPESSDDEDREKIAASHVLVVDDNAQNLELLVAYLEGLGCKVRTAFDGVDALDKVKEAVPDLILLDIMMPKTDGYTIGTMIRNHERTRHIPIMIVSALREMSRLFDATVKVEGFLTKPFSPEDLLGTVAKILAAKAPAKA